MTSGSSSGRERTSDESPLGALEWTELSQAFDRLFETRIVDASFERALHLVLARTHSDRGALGYIDGFGELVWLHETGFGSSPEVDPRLIGLAPEDWSGAWGAAISDGRVSVRNRAEPDGGGRLHAPFQLAAPIVFAGKTVGLLYAANLTTDYGPADAARTELVAKRLGPMLSYELGRRHARRQLDEAEEMTAAAAEGERFFMMSRDLMAIADTHIRRANLAFTNLLGWEEYELRNKSIGELTHPADRDLLEREFTLMRTEPNREHPPVSVQMVSKDGETHSVEWVGAATDEGRVYAVGRDVSALTQAMRKLADQNSELQRLHEEARAEEQLAGRLLAHMRTQGCLDSPGIQYVASSLGFFNGDVTLAALTKSGELRWMLGDFTGHGLSAALGTVPLAGAFYTSCRQDLHFADAIASINDLLKGLLPPGLFCAAGFLSLNRDSDVLSIWNSGLPPILVHETGTGRIVQYASQCLPLGLLSSSELGIEPTRVPVRAGDEIFLFSDGLTEATDATGQLFSVERVERAVLAADGAGAGFAAIVKAVTDYRGAVAASDDVSLVSVTVGQTRRLTLGPRVHRP